MSTLSTAPAGLPAFHRRRTFILVPKRSPSGQDACIATVQQPPVEQLALAERPRAHLADCDTATQPEGHPVGQHSSPTARVESGRLEPRRRSHDIR